MPTGKAQGQVEHPAEHAHGRILWLAFIVVAVGSFLGPLSGSIVNVALPAIAGDFSTDLQSVKWVVLVYLAGSTMLLPLAGKLGRWLGEEQLYFSGFSIFAAAAVLCAVSPDRAGLGWLIAVRLVQSVGAACLFAVSLALLTRYVPAERRSMAFGVIGSVVSLALIAGPPLGVIISDTIGWRWVFWVQVPVAILGAILGALLIRPALRNDRELFPWFSSVTWCIAICGLTLVGEAFSKGLWFDHIMLTGAVTIVAALGFVLTEYRGPRLFNYMLFTHPAFWRGAIGGVLVNVSIIALFLLAPFYLDDFLKLGTAQRGLLFAISPLCTVFVGPTAGALADRRGFRLLILAGLAMLSVSFALLSWAVTSHSLVLLGLGFAAVGIGSGIFSGPNYSAMMGSVHAAERSIASSMCSLTRSLGFLIGISMASLWFGMFLVQIGGHKLMLAARQEQLASAVNLHQFSYAFGRELMICAGLCLLALIFSLGFPNRVHTPNGD